MTVLPIVGRELKVASRRRGTYWMRFATALLAVILFVWIYLAADVPAATAGRVVFVSLSVLAFALCGLAGVLTTSDCLSEEKREGTLGLLFLTDLKGYDVVLGKLVANSLAAFYGLVAIFPVLALPLLMGGVPLRSFALLLVVLVATLLVSLSAGILVSTFSRESRRASGGTVLLLLFIMAGIPLLGVFLTEYGVISASSPPEKFLIPSPAFALKQVMSSLKATGPFQASSFQQSVGCLAGMVFLFLGTSAVRLPRAWQDKPEGPRSHRLRMLRRRLTLGNVDYRRRLRDRLLAVNPVLWLAGRDRLKRLLVWLLLGIGALGWLWGFAEHRSSWMEFPISVMFLLLLHSIVKVWLASEACRQLVDDRRSGALELLLATPLKIHEILRGLRMALTRQFGGPVIALLIADLLLLLGGLEQGAATQGETVILLFFVGMGMLVMDYFSLKWVGMWAGISARSFNHAVRTTVFRVLILPWALFLASLFAFALFVSSFHSFRQFNPEPAHLIWWWFALGIANNIVFVLLARSRLFSEFRVLATQPQAMGRRWFAWLRKESTPR